VARAGWSGLRYAFDDEGERERVKALFAAEPGPESLQIDFDAVGPGRQSEVALSGPVLYLVETLKRADVGSAPAPDFHLHSSNDVRAAEAFLFAQIRKSVELDGVIAYYVMRPIARVFTKALLNTSVSPNQATLSALACGIAAAIFAGLGGATYVAVAGLLYWTGGVLDCIDGELARMRQQSSKMGEWLDSMVDEFSTIALMIGLGVGLSRDGLGSEWMLLGLGGAVLAVATLSPIYLDLHRRKLPIDTAQFPWFFGSASASSVGAPEGFIGKGIHIISYFIRRDANITGTSLLLIFNLRRISLSIILMAYAVASVLLIAHSLVMRSRQKSG